MRSPWLWPELFWRISSCGKEFKNNLKTITEFTQGVYFIGILHTKFPTQKVIFNRKRERTTQNDNAFLGEEKKNSCFLDILLDLQEKSDFTDEDIREEVETFMFEGDTIFIL